MNPPREGRQVHDPVIVCAVDDRYAMPLAVMLRTLGDHLKRYARIQVWVLDGGVTSRNKRRIDRSLPPDRMELHWVRPGHERLGDMPVFGHVSLCTYYRFLLGEILPAELDKVIYLDVDMLACSDIGELWDIDVSDVVIGAAPEAGATMGSMLDQDILRGCQLDPALAYFNAGVLLINLRRWREHRLLEKAVDFARQHGKVMRYWDQDVLNCLLAGEWHRLEPKWNHIVDHLAKPEEGASGGRQPADEFMHFASAIKPWTWWAGHPARALYFEWVDRTDWRGWRPRPPLKATIGNRHWYGKWIRATPVVGRVWAALANRWKAG